MSESENELRKASIGLASLSRKELGRRCLSLSQHAHSVHAASAALAPSFGILFRRFGRPCIFLFFEMPPFQILLSTPAIVWYKRPEKGTVESHFGHYHFLEFLLCSVFDKTV